MATPRPVSTHADRTMSAQLAAANPFTVWAVRGAAVLGSLILLSVCAPLISAAVTAGVGLMALSAMAFTAFAVVQALPLAMQKLENRLLLLRKAEARANPMEQLQNDCLRREERLHTFRRALVQIGGQIESLGQMLEERRLQDPSQVLDRQQRALTRMTQFYEANIQRLQEAHEALEAFRHQVQQKMFEWEFAQAGQVVMDALNPSEVEDLMQGLLTDEALRSVQNRFNTVFAELDVDLRSINSPTRTMLDAQRVTAMDALDLSTLNVRRVP